MSIAAAVWIDGEPASPALLDDRGLHYGDGLFETVIVRGGRARFAALHAARLARGAATLGIPVDAATLIAGQIALLEASGEFTGEGVLKLIVTRGDMLQRGYGLTGRERPRSFGWWYPGPVAPPTAPCAARLLTSRWGENPALAGLKHLNRLEQVLARRELQALPDAADEGIVCSASGQLCSGTMSNLFLLRETELLTPPVNRCGIAGVMRAVVLREAAAVGLVAREAPLREDDLATATGVFFTNVRLGVWPVARLEGRSLSPPDAVLALRDHVARLE